MRVVELVPSLHVGGAERLVALLSRELARIGHEVTIVSLYPRVDSWIERELEGFPVRFLGKRRGADPRVLPRLARTLTELRPHVLHTHLHSLPYVLPARLGAGPARSAPIVHTLHNLAARENEWYGRLLQGAAFRAGVEPVAIGAAVAASVEAVYGLRPRHTIPNGIPVAAYQAPPGTRARLREELGIPSEAPVFLAVGRLDPQKDHATLLQAFADPALRATRLLVAGDGDLRGALEREAHALGVADRVRFLGMRADVPSLLAAADVFVLSSRWEGNPLVVMEAMAAGLPVLVTAVGCVPDLVPDDAGRRVPAGDPAAFAGEMRALAGDAALRGRLGAAGRAIAAARFDTSTMARAYADLFHAITDRGVRQIR